jgi:glutamyl-tRNA synthetase
MTPSTPKRPKGRIAPTPSGRLHIGHAWAFLLAWLSMRSVGGHIVLRIEDIDAQRSKPEFVQGILDDLEWLGLDWDEGPIFQSRRRELYDAALERLNAAGLLYKCYCTRKELRHLAAAPHAGEQDSIYPGLCRNLSQEELETKKGSGRPPSLRLKCSGRVQFKDLLAGCCDVEMEEKGDVALCRSDGVHAYQLAVVVDDAEAGITEVLRGRDLLDSTPWQLYLYQALGYQAPEFVHVPLLCDADGVRLAKRQESLTLQALRAAGVLPEQLIGFLAFQGGMSASLQKAGAAGLISSFSLEQLPKEDILLQDDPVAFFKGI